MEFDRATREAIHQMVKRYGAFNVATDVYQIPRLTCEWCRRFGMISPEQAADDRLRIQEQEEHLRPSMEQFDRIHRELGFEDLDGVAETPEAVITPGEGPKKEDQ